MQHSDSDNTALRYDDFALLKQKKPSTRAGSKSPHIENLREIQIVCSLLLPFICPLTIHLIENFIFNFIELFGFRVCYAIWDKNYVALSTSKDV